LSTTLAEGRYRVERTLGRGGMAVVYLAADEELGRQVAIKVLGDGFSADEALRARFRREARVAARLSHPNVVRIYDVGEGEGALFIVMELVPGRTLAEVGKLRAGAAVELVLQACAGLQHAHDAGLVHRDLKPANLLLRDDGVVKIADFGIARAAEHTRLTEVGTILGTAAYLSPEQAAGEEVTAASDIYSLGAVLYELLTGRPPHGTESLADLAERQGAGTVTPVRELEPAVPLAVEAAVMRCLAREPRYRPRSPSALAAELSGGSELPTGKLDRPPTAATRPHEAGSADGRRGRARLLVPAAVLAVVAAVVLGVLKLGGGGSGQNTREPASPSPVTPPARGSTPADEAHSLSAWLRLHSR
jgi:eukaryotic-like serine/threonine-protein kinase